MKINSSIGKAVKDTQTLISDAQDKLNQLQNLQQNQGGYLSDADHAEIAKMQALLQGSIVLLEQVQSGAFPAPGSAAVVDPATALTSQNLKVGFNGAFENKNNVITVENNGPGTKGALVFKADDSMSSITGKNSGKDLVITVVYTDKHTEKFLIKNGATSNTTLIFAADTTTKGIVMDFTKVKRIHKDAPGVTLIGGSGNDTLIGSQGDDTIIGNEGIDKLYGLGGNDTIKGLGGSDTIDGGTGTNAIDAGSGNDSVSKLPGSQDFVTGEENNVTTKTTKLPQANWPSKSGGWDSALNSDGELVLSKNASNSKNEINFTIPAGYTMAYASKEGNDLILNLSSDTIPPTTATIRIKGMLDPNNFTKLSLKGSKNGTMIDFGGVNTQFNQISLTKAGADDILIAPTNALDDFKIKLDEIGKSTLTSFEVDKIRKAMEIEKKDDQNNPTGVTKHWGDVDKSELSGNVITLTPKKDQTTVDLNLPTGYQTAIIQKDKKTGDYMLTMVKKEVDASGQPTGKSTTLLVRIKVQDGNPKTVTVNGMPPPTLDIATALSGSAKAGLMVGSQYSTQFSESGDNIVKS